MASTSLTPAQVAAYEAFYRDHYHHVLRALSLTVNADGLGREAADEAFTRAFERWDDVATYDHPVGWVYRVGYNWSISHLRRKRPTLLPGMPDVLHHDPIPHPELAPLIAALPMEQRAVIVLRFFNDWTIDQIAEALNSPSGTIKSRLSRALDELRRSLGE